MLASPCPSGDPTICAILEVAGALSAGPSAFTVWATLIVPSVAAAASTAVAIVSARIAHGARRTAEESELKRARAEDERARREKQHRLDTAIREMFVGIANHIRALEEYEKVLSDWRAFYIQRAHSGQSNPHPTKPSDSEVLALVASARLEADSKADRDMLIDVHNAVVGARRLKVETQATVLKQQWDTVVNSRHLNDS